MAPPFFICYIVRTMSNTTITKRTNPFMVSSSYNEMSTVLRRQLIMLSGS